MIHLTAADYRVMPWANGKGTTTELWREDQGGAMLWRLSRASVVEDGPFSIFPGINRNLTVIMGPGFDLIGDGIDLPARPLQPVAFSGDLVIRAENVVAPSDDFNVMVAARLPPPTVTVSPESQRISPLPNGLICLYAMESLGVDGRTLNPTDLIMSRRTLEKGPGLALVVQISDGGLSQILNQP
jgi:uncharacterized protein